VAAASALLERNIRQLGFTVRALPKRVPLYTLDEADLARRLMRADQTDIDPRVDHDVNVIAGILTLRRGRVWQSVDDARVIFATPTTLVVRKVIDWYRSQGLEGVPPIIHQIGLSNIAWLKNPGGAATRLKRSELVALCAAALRPTAKMWRRFTDELRQLRNSGQVTSDEEVAVLTSQLVDTRLAEIDSEDDVDTETVADIVERVRETFAAEAALKVTEAVDAKTRELSEVVEGAQVSVRQHAELSRAASEEAAESREAHRQLELRITRNANLLAMWISNACYWLIGVVVALGTLLALIGFSLTSAYSASVVAGGVLVIFAVLSFVDLFAGVSVRELRTRLESYIARSVRGWWSVKARE